MTPRQNPAHRATIALLVLLCAAPALLPAAEPPAAGPPAADVPPLEGVARMLDAWAHGRPVEARRIALETLGGLLGSLEASDEDSPLRRGTASFLIRFLDDLHADTGDPEPLGEAFQRWSESCPDPLLATELAWAAERSFARSGREGEHPVRDGALVAWAVIGPFDNERGSGFRIPYPPEERLAPGDPCRGKEREVRWRVLPVQDALIDLDEVLDPDDQSLAYAVTHIRVDAPQEAALRLGSDEAIQAWVNGERVLERDVRRPCRQDQDAVGIRLQAGWNRILLKVCDREGDWRFRARLTTPEGEPIVPVEVAPLPDPLPEPARVEGTAPAIDGGPIADLRRWVSSHPDAPLPALMLARMIEQRHAYDEGQPAHRPLLEAASLAAPRDPHILFALAEASSDVARMEAERTEHRRRERLEETLSLDPAYLPALVALCGYYRDVVGSSETALSFADRAVALSPDSPLAWDARLRSLQGIGWEPERDLAIDALPAALASTPRLLGWRAVRAASRFRTADYDRILAEWARQDAASEVAMPQREMRDIEGGRTDDAVRTLAALIAGSPFGIRNHVRRHDLLLGQGKPEEAREELMSALAIAPENSALHLALGDLEARIGREAQARAAWTEALRLRPSDRSLASLMEHLERDRIPLEERVRADVPGLLAEARGKIPPSNDPIAWILRREHVFLRRDGTHTRVRHLLLEIRTEAGIQPLQVHLRPYTQGDERAEIKTAVVHHKDGSTAQAQIVDVSGRIQGFDGLVAAQFPALRVGDVIEVLDRVDEVRQGFFGDYFGTLEEFGAFFPSFRTDFSLTIPDERTVYLHATAGVGEPRLTRDEEERTTTRTWTVGMGERIEREPSQPPLREIGQTLQVSTYATWQEFGTWYANLIRHQSEPDDAIRAKVEDLTQGCTNEQEILQALYGFVANGIEYRAWEFGIHGWNPYTASQVLSNGFGDCKDKANLLATMLRLKGIDACPVLIHSEEEGRAEEDLTLPLIEHFNHCIARARLADGRTLWLDGTAQDHPWDALPDMDQGATVFVVTPDGGSIERLPERAAADCACEASFDAVVGEDLAAVVEVRIHATGTRGAILRNVLNVEGHRQEILENLHGRRFPGCRVELGAFPDLDDLSAPVDLRYTLRIPGLLRPDGPSRWRLPLLEDFFLMDTFSDMAQLPDREHDLLLGPPWQSTTAATVRLPPSLSFASPGACAEILEPAAECRLTRETPSPTLLRMEQRVSFLASRIRRGDYAAFRSACNRADEARRAEPVIERARAE